MKTNLYRKTLFAVYQTSLFIGILMLPIAVLVNRAGVTLPMHRMISHFADAYDEVANIDQ